MLEGILVGDGLTQNNILNIFDRNNRDRSYEPYILLAEYFYAHGVTLKTPDMTSGEVAFELHMNAHSKMHKDKPAYLLLLETPLICPANGLPPTEYRKVFTWNDSLVNDPQYIKINFPNPITIPFVGDFGQRDLFCCLIAGNKAPAQHDIRELYSERIRVIRWFEKHAHQDFALYGAGWDLPPAKPQIYVKIIRRLMRQLSPWIGLRPFPSYRGKLERKRDILLRTRFSICYENMRDMPGYITEKLFDCFFAGCVPVYWGASNVCHHVPHDCFIDRRNFADTAAIYTHLRNMDEYTYVNYQRRIASFLASDAAKPFSSEVFAKTIVNAVMRDLGHLA